MLSLSAERTPKRWKRDPPRACALASSAPLKVALEVLLIVKQDIQKLSYSHTLSKKGTWAGLWSLAKVPIISTCLASFTGTRSHRLSSAARFPAFRRWLSSSLPVPKKTQKKQPDKSTKNDSPIFQPDRTGPVPLGCRCYTTLKPTHTHTRTSLNDSSTHNRTRWNAFKYSVTTNSLFELEWSFLCCFCLLGSETVPIGMHPNWLAPGTRLTCGLQCCGSVRWVGNSGFHTSGNVPGPAGLRLKFPHPVRSGQRGKRWIHCPCERLRRNRGVGKLSFPVALVGPDGSYGCPCFCACCRIRWCIKWSWVIIDLVEWRIEGRKE